MGLTYKNAVSIGCEYMFGYLIFGLLILGRLSPIFLFGPFPFERQELIKKRCL